MQKTKLFAIVITTAAILTAATTTIITQIQPAYSQATHCTLPFAFRDCATPGQNPTTTSCSGPRFCDTDTVTHQEAGQTIAEIHRSCSSSVDFSGDCVVLPP